VSERVGVYAHVALLIQHATRIRHILTSFVTPLAPSGFFGHNLINGTIFGIRSHWTWTACFDFLYNDSLRYCHNCENVFMWSTRYSCRILVRAEFWFAKKIANIKFNLNPSNGSQVVPCGRTDRMKLIITFSNFARAPKTCTKTEVKLH
jgi:hypothetical protein